MKKSVLWIGGGAAALSIAVLALPSRSAALKEQDDTWPEVRVERLPKVQELNRIQIDGDRVLQEAGRMMQQYPGALAGMEALTGPETQQVTIFDGDEGPSWLGVETHEVTAENAKELKLPVERGVVVAGGAKESRAAKGGGRGEEGITAAQMAQGGGAGPDGVVLSG